VFVAFEISEVLICSKHTVPTIVLISTATNTNTSTRSGTNTGTSSSTSTSTSTTVDGINSATHWLLQKF
jgi:hypothetical protein